MVFRLHFTKAIIEALDPQSRRYDVYDDDPKQLAISITPSGAKTFYLVKKIKGRVERIRIGRFPTATISNARKRAWGLIGGIAVGDNPAEVKRQQGEEITLGELWNLYLERYAKKRKKSWRYDVNVWNKHLERWSEKPVDSITPATVARWHSEIEDDCGPYAANRAKALLSSLYGRSLRLMGVPLPNPCLGVTPAKEIPRDRYLLPDELRRFLDALDGETRGRGKAIADALRLMLFTGLRTRNVLGLRWSHVEMRDRVISIPAEKMKANRPLTIPAHDRVIEILKRRKRAVGRSVWVFPSSGARGYLYSIRGTWDSILGAAKIEGFQIRDLRHTYATYAGEAGTPYEVIAALLGHSLPGMTSRYSHATPTRLSAGVNKTVDHILTVAGREVAEVVAFPKVKRG